jgi:hypothetical protein
MSLSVGTAWHETVAVARREARLVFPATFLLLSLPAAILRLIAPVTAPGRMPESGPWLLFVPVLVAASLVGALAISRIALAQGEGSRATFAAGLRGFVPLLGATLLGGFAAALVAMTAILLGALVAAPIFSVLLALSLLALLIFLWVRLLLLTPAAAAEPIGPADLIRRSWALTARRFWHLLGLLLAAVLLSLVALMAAGALGGIAVRLAAGQPQPGTLVMLLVALVSALLQAPISGLFTILVARLYAQAAEALPTV